MHEKQVRIFLKGQARDCCINLKHRNDEEARIILKSIRRIKHILQENPQFGNPLAKRLIPPELSSLGIQNLYRVKLSNYWRLLYTIEGDGIIIFIFILKIFDHNQYNKLFGYMKR